MTQLADLDCKAAQLTAIALGLSTRITERLSVRVGVGASGSTTSYGFGLGYAMGGGSGAFEPCYVAKK